MIAISPTAMSRRPTDPISMSDRMSVFWASITNYPGRSA